MNWKYIKWFHPHWYQYIFSNLKDFDDGMFHKVQVVICRIKGHPKGPVWYNNGFEPDMSCKDCGDEL